MIILRTFKYICCAALLMVGGEAAQGFALLGPIGNGGDSWQTPTIGYGIGGDLGAPKNLGEEYRRNTPVIYYAYDRNFSEFFGADGENAIDAAFAIMNNLTNVDSYSAALTEFPFDSQSMNYEAQALGLTDLKSEMLTVLMEQMGLAEPERFTWTLHDRYLPPTGKCPIDEEYLVVQRNFAESPTPINEVQYSPYVNNTLYSYEISEICTGPNPLAVTVPFKVNEDDNSDTAVAGRSLGLGVVEFTNGWASSTIGGFYTGLTRDDVAGLRYLLSTNNINHEDPAPGSSLQVTNGATFLMTSNLTDLILFSQTNAPSVVESNFPGVVVGSSSNYYTVEQIPNIVAYYTNFPGQAFGVPPVLVVATNGFTPVPMTNYVDTFVNVVTNSYSSNTVARIQTIKVGLPPGAALGTPLTTNITYKQVILTNVPSGDYFIIPPGTCGYNIVQQIYTNVTLITNAIQNIASASTNIVTPTNSFTLSYEQNLVIVVTNHWYIVEPCTYSTNIASADYPGIERVRFVRETDGLIDPLTGNFTHPVTNTYTMTVYDPLGYTNSTQTFRRILTRPDILISASDMASPNSGEIGASFLARGVNFDENNVYPGLAGPGTITPTTTVSFNKVGNVYGNGSLAINSLSTNEFLSEITHFGLLRWASFGPSTNDIEVYPNGTSIQDLENQLIISVNPKTLPDGINGYTYPAVTFTVTGGQSPYTWSLAPASQPLPAGLSLSQSGVLSGMPTDNPPGTYDFTIQLNDSAARVVTLNYSIIIHNP